MITITPGSQGFNVPPPSVGNMAVPPPMGRFPPPQRFAPRHQFFQPFKPYVRGLSPLDPEFDGKRLRKSAMRKTVDYNSALIKMLEGRVWQRDFRDRRALQPDVTSLPDLLPPPSYDDNAINAVTTRFVKAATNKMRCPIFCMAWTPEGRRLVTGASSGEFTLWNGLTFNFETILQAHDSPVRTMVWSHNDVWMVTADHAGYVKYWQSNMNNVKMFLAHKEAIRGISFSPSDNKFATCSDDGTVRIWDFQRCQEEKTLRGHGADVKCVHWHPQMGLIISGSKDNQQPVKLWDPKTGQSLATLHAHKSTVMDIKWNNNGNWVVTASRDHLLKLFDLRNLSTELQTFRGHKKESSSVAWHPYHEGLFCSGGSDGAILFWHVGADKEVGAIEQAHDSIVWTLAWHPLGHILCSGSNDHSSKFWTRNRPGDQMRDKYNLNTLPSNLAGLDDNEIDDMSMIPGMGPEDKVDIITPVTDDPSAIPGLDIDSAEDKSKAAIKKVPYSKPIPKNFQAHWNHLAVPDDDKDGFDAIELLNQLIVNQPGVIPLADIEPESLVIYGKQIDLKPEDGLTQAIKKGCEAFARYINSGAVEELNDVRPYIDLSDEEPVAKKEPQSGDEQDNADEEEDYDQYADPYHHEDDDHLIAEQDQDMRNMVMRPPPGFMGSDSMGPPSGPSPSPRSKGEMFRPRMPMPSSDGPPHMFRPQGNYRPNFRPDSQGPGQFQRPPMNFNRSQEFRDGNRPTDFHDNNERMEYRDNNRPPDFRENRGQDFRDNRGPEFQENMYRGPPPDSFKNRNKNQNDGFRSEFGVRGRGSNAPPFRGRNQGFRENNRDDFNREDYNEEDEDMGGSYGNGGYPEEGEKEDQWNNEEQYEDNSFNKSWNEEGSGDQEGMDDEYHGNDRRPPVQQYQQKSFPRSRPPRSRGGPRGGRGFDRGGPRMRGRGRGRGAPRGGFRSRGRNPRR